MQRKPGFESIFQPLDQAMPETPPQSTMDLFNQESLDSPFSFSLNERGFCHWLIKPLCVSLQRRSVFLRSALARLQASFLSQPAPALPMVPPSVLEFTIPFLCLLFSVVQMSNSCLPWASPGDICIFLDPVVWGVLWAKGAVLQDGRLEAIQDTKIHRHLLSKTVGPELPTVLIFLINWKVTFVLFCCCC